MRAASLEDVLAYRNKEVIDRFLDDWDVTRRDANQLFDDVKRYLWLTAQNKRGIMPVPIVDEMWHTFLMVSADYYAFCMRYFGKVIHHVPTTTREIQRARRAPAQARREAARYLERTLTLVYDRLGEPVVLRWYVTYQERFGQKFFDRGRRRKLIWGPRRMAPSLRKRARR